MNNVSKSRKVKAGTVRVRIDAVMEWCIDYDGAGSMWLLTAPSLRS